MAVHSLLPLRSFRVCHRSQSELGLTSAIPRASYCLGSATAHIPTSGFHSPFRVRFRDCHWPQSGCFFYRPFHTLFCLGFSAPHIHWGWGLRLLAFVRKGRLAICPAPHYGVAPGAARPDILKSRPAIEKLKDRITPHDSASRMKIKRVQKKVRTIYVWSCCALHLLLCSLCLCSLCLSLSLSLPLSLSLSLSLSLCFFLSFQTFFICLSLSASAITAMLASQPTCRTTSPQCSTEAETEFKSRKHARVSMSQSQDGRTESLESIRLESTSTWNLALRPLCLIACICRPSAGLQWPL